MIFIESTLFSKVLSRYLADEEYMALQWSKSPWEGGGGGNILSDYIVKLFRVPQSAEAAFAAMSAQERSWLNGFAGGVNAYIAEYNAAHGPQTVETFSAVDVLAWGIYGQFNRQLTMAQGDLSREVKTGALAALSPLTDARASNQWVVGPDKTGGGPAMVLADPHLPWWGGNQWYEAHLKDEAGVLHVTGVAVLGTPLIAMGRNEHVAWSQTSNGTLDFADCYREKLAVPGDLSEYLFAPAPTGKKPIVQDSITIQVKGASAVTAPAYYTHHGPLVPVALAGYEPVFTLDGEHVYSLALSMMDGTEDSYPGALISGILRQIYRFNIAQSVRDVKLALGLQGEPDSYPLDEVLQMVKWNIVTADRNGDIYYIYNGRVPVRGNAHPEDPAYWDKPREGWTGDDEWDRTPDGRTVLWAVSALPQVANCPDGYMANCNVSPWYVCPSSGIDPALYPSYLAMDNMTDRQIRALELLGTDAEITPVENRRYSRDLHIVKADKLEVLFFSFYDPAVTPDLITAAGLLASEPNKAEKDNRSVALLYAWASELGGAANSLPDDPAELTPEQKDLLVSTLRSARDTLTACPFGLDPLWSDVHYIDHGEIFPAAGGPNPIPTLFMVGGSQQGCGPIVGEGGSSFMQVTVLESAGLSSRSVRPIGASDDPSNPHFNDETARFVEDDPETAYKANPFADGDILPGGAYWESTRVLEW